MKRRPGESHPTDDAITQLAAALLSLESVEQLRAFLEDLCTPAELEALGDRWKVVPLLREGLPYRDIHERTQVSVTTIGRVARTLERGAGGYAAAMRKREAADPTAADTPPRDVR